MKRFSKWCQEMAQKGNCKVQVFEYNGKYVAEFSDGTMAITNPIVNRIEIRWGSGTHSHKGMVEKGAYKQWKTQTC